MQTRKGEKRRIPNGERKRKSTGNAPENSGSGAFRAVGNLAKTQDSIVLDPKRVVMEKLVETSQRSVAAHRFQTLPNLNTLKYIKQNKDRISAYTCFVVRYFRFLDNIYFSVLISIYRVLLCVCSPLKESTLLNLPEMKSDTSICLASPSVVCDASKALPDVGLNTPSLPSAAPPERESHVSPQSRECVCCRVCCVCVGHVSHLQLTKSFNAVVVFLIDFDCLVLFFA